MSLEPFRKAVAVGLCLSLLAGCATMKDDGRPQTAVQQATARCIASVAAGAILGAIIGNNTGSGNARRGALRGAAVGAGVCAIMLAVANQQDRARLEAIQAQALETDQQIEESYVGSDGRQRSFRAVSYQVAAPAPAATAASSEASVAAPAYTYCRELRTTIAVQDAGETETVDYTCRNPVTLQMETVRRAA